MLLTWNLLPRALATVHPIINFPNKAGQGVRLGVFINPVCGFIHNLTLLVRAFMP